MVHGVIFESSSATVAGEAVAYHCRRITCAGYCLSGLGTSPKWGDFTNDRTLEAL